MPQRYSYRPTRSSHSSSDRGQSSFNKRDNERSAEPATGLAGGAVVHFVFGVADPLDRRPADRARLAVPAVHGHPLPKCSDLLREPVSGFYL